MATIAFLDEDYKVLGETIVEDATWRLIENVFYLDAAITVEIIEEGMIQYCSVQCPLWAKPVILNFQANLARLVPGGTVHFALHDFSMTFDNDTPSDAPIKMDKE